MNRDIAHDAIIRSADAVVGQLFFLRLANGHGGFIVGLGVLEGLLRLVIHVAAGDARIEQLVLALDLDRVVVEERFLLPLRGTLRLDSGQLRLCIDLHQQSDWL